MNAFISDKPHWWQWLTVLSLDAALVAVLWQWLLAGAARTPLGAAPTVVLGASVWLAYAADRWIEGWRLVPEQVRTQRHRFYQRWRWPVAVVWLSVLAVDVATALVHFGRRELLAGLVLLGPVAAYLLSHQLVHRHRRWRAPKEVCVAALLGGGVAVFLVVRPEVAWCSLGPPLGLFAALCFANCALISVWEHDVDRSHGQTSLALQYRRGRAFARVLPWILAAAALALGWSEAGPVRCAAACVCASSILLGALDRIEGHIGWQLARVLADVVLMTPLVPMVAAQIR